jgi:branched-chain amino acid transport system substrate-binding protein
MNSRLHRRHWLVLAALACGWSAPSFAEEGVSPKAIVIGQSLALQGGKNSYGVAVAEGIQAWLKVVNGRGGVAGRQIALRTLDDNNQSATAKTNAQQLISQEKVFILFGSIEGGPSSGVMEVAVAAGVPFFGPMAGSPGLRSPHQPLVYPVRAEHREEFRALLQYARKTGATRVGFFRSDSEVGLQHLENVRRISKELGLEVVADMPFKSDITPAQLDELARRIRSTQAQVVFNHGSAGTYEKLVRATLAQGNRNVFYGVNSGSTQLAHNLGDLARGMVFAQIVPSPWERKTALARAYQVDYARAYPDREFSYGSLEGYLTARALVQALELAGPNPTRASFIAGLQNTDLDIEGLAVRYTPQAHTGLSFVDLSIVTRDGRFQH